MTSTAIPDDLAARIVRAQEAIQDDDTDLALAILCSREADLTPDESRQHICPHCRIAFRLPGGLEDHLDRVHPDQDPAALGGRAA